ncbi:neuronal acetylcholine receptor subunit alpha-5-like [Dendronephthya gigantea]|uniref:neuronal acetylcholine receptor subunit alpha-5-like n=1 Tax=Dendronephthya gigantea TaxID=151771 RepID=UPI00106C9EDD|nr:neuronal acetylcholine receptor subunit alpha-5-like [Dendronephthya gigantea]
MAYCSFLQMLLVCFFYLAYFCQRFRLASAGTIAGDHIAERHRLLEFLTNNSDIKKEILPAPVINKPVNVEVRIKLRQIADVNEKNQAVRIVVWLRLQWNNPLLRWDPEQYGGIKSVNVNNKYFWLPDVAIFNEASQEDEIEILHKRLVTKLVISKDGNCTWSAPVTLNSQCRIDVARFPFDEQTCQVSIGSWTYSGYKINVSHSDENVAMIDYIRNGEWDVKSAILSQNFRYYLPDNIPYPDITLTLKIKRRPLYYTLQLILPLAVISMLTFFSFILPLKSEGQISILITLVVAISVFSIIISSVLPETSDSASVLQTYCIGIFLSVTMVSFPAVMTTRLVNYSYPMPNWFRKCMRIPKKQKEKEVGADNHINEIDANESQRNSVRKNHESVNETEEYKKQWKTAAKVIHRIGLLCFLLCFAGFNIFLLVEYKR